MTKQQSSLSDCRTLLSLGDTTGRVQLERREEAMVIHTTSCLAATLFLPSFLLRLRLAPAQVPAHTLTPT